MIVLARLTLGTLWFVAAVLTSLITALIMPFIVVYDRFYTKLDFS
jgi:hypothetical protein